MMGGALVRGFLAAGVRLAGDIIAADADSSRREALVRECGIRAASDNAAAAGAAQTIILAVKPAIISAVIAEIAPVLHAGQEVVSVAAGVPLRALQPAVEAGCSVFRVMPNTPCLVRAGAIAVAAGPEVGEGARRRVLALLGAVGQVIEVRESLMDAVTGLSGSGPAYVFVFIEALADGGVAVGLPRATALQLAAQTVLGAARLLQETGKHPAALKDMVASPGGTTIAGLAALEEAGFRTAVIRAVQAAAKRSRELGQ